MRSRTLVIVAGCALAAITLAGCKSSTTTATGSGTTPSASAPVDQSSTPADQASTPSDQSSTPSDQSSTPATTGGGTVDDGLGHAVAVCSLLPVATVAQLSGEALVNGKEADLLPDAKAYSCLYTDSLGTSNVSVAVLAKNAANSFNAGLTLQAAEAKPISNLGDKAYSAVTGVSALFGNVEISVTGLQNNDAAAVKIIQTLQPQL